MNDDDEWVKVPLFLVKYTDMDVWYGYFAFHSHASYYIDYIFIYYIKLKLPTHFQINKRNHKLLCIQWLMMTNDKVSFHILFFYKNGCVLKLRWKWKVSFWRHSIHMEFVEPYINLFADSFQKFILKLYTTVNGFYFFFDFELSRICLLHDKYLTSPM